MKTYFGESGRIELERSRCHGYKKVVFDNVEVAQRLVAETQGTDLVYKGVSISKEELSNDVRQYTFICKEFGLYGINIPAKISVIFCDDGWMVVTLLEGTLLIDYDGQLLQPVIGDDTYPPVNTNKIFWCNTDSLLSLKDNFGDNIRSVHWQDFEYIFTISGGMEGSLRRFTWRANKDEYIDLSLGAVAVMEEQERQKESARQARNILKMTVYNVDRSQGLEYDEDDVDDYDEDDDDEYDDFDL